MARNRSRDDNEPLSVNKIKSDKFIATWITRNAEIKPTVFVVLVQECPDLICLFCSQRGSPNDSGNIDSGNPGSSRSDCVCCLNSY